MSDMTSVPDMVPMAAVPTKGDTLETSSTYRFLLNATKNKTNWDLTGATVTIYFKKAGGAKVGHTATLAGTPTNQAYYDCPTTELTAGDWSRSWRVVQGAIDITCGPIVFSVVDSP